MRLLTVEADALVDASVGISTVVRFESYGLEAGLAAGIAFGLADISKILLPVIAGLIGWSRQMKATAGICVVVSLWLAVNVYLDGAGRDLLAKQHGAMVYAEAQKQITDLEVEAASLRTLATAEASKGCCGPNCRTLTEQATQAALRLQTARTARAQMRPVEISGLAAVLAAASGIGVDVIARGIGTVKALLFLALIESLVWLSVPAMVVLSQTGEHGVVVDAIPIAVEMSLAPIARPAASGTKAYYLGRLERDHPEIAKRIRCGELSVYAASVAAGIRKPPTKSQWTRINAYVPPVREDA